VRYALAFEALALVLTETVILLVCLSVNFYLKNIKLEHFNSTNIFLFIEI
jgi:hypothetical protein